MIIKVKKLTKVFQNYSLNGLGLSKLVSSLQKNVKKKIIKKSKNCLNI